MAANYAKHVSQKTTPQSEPVPGKNQTVNSAGGYVFQVDDWARLNRFLILGAEGGSYYVTEKDLTIDNAQVVNRCLDADPKRTVNTIVEISEAGRAPKNDPAVFALALAASHKSDMAKVLAYAAINKVCRIGTHLFQFVQACEELRGWGRGFMKAVSNWYLEKNPDQLAYQVTKYQSRNLWSHRDVLRKCHAVSTSPVQGSILRWIAVGMEKMGVRSVTRGKDKAMKETNYGSESAELLPDSIVALEKLKASQSVEETVKLIETYEGKAPRELVPTKFLADKRVWGALLPHMPMTALIRNLGTMTRNGLLTPMSDAVIRVCKELRNAERIKKARVHPLAILVAMKIYQQGHGMKSDGEGWKPSQQIVDAANDAFYLAFDAVEPTNRRWMFGLDVSASMSTGVCGSPVSCCEAATALSLVSTRVEPFTFTGRFNTGFEPVSFGKSTRLDDALRYTRNINGGGTDASLTFAYAKQHKIPVDVFVTITDSESWAGMQHTFQALNDYRNAMGIASKSIVLAMTASKFTVADVNDPNSLDICGMSTDVPAVMNAFAVA